MRTNKQLMSYCYKNFPWLQLILELSTRQDLSYGTATILLDHVDDSCRRFSYDAAVAVLKGMVEWMTLYDEFYEWTIAVSVERFVVGYATVKNRNVPVGEATSLLEPVTSGLGSVGTA